MLKFSLTLPIIISALYILLSQAELKLPTCALSCGQTAGSQVGCNITDQNCVCNSPEFIAILAGCVLVECDGNELDDGLEAAYLGAFCL
ncbi:hypothetical protein BGY98DRAFT_948454 [Russula aff. rugulosa BPL654]|nr:hypothetical protein BGY98DRAFT_948454 [Russula aff. rugulosa BPL654]